jgi:quinol monooxygenase YgiN
MKRPFQTFFDERKERIRQFPGCTHLALWKDKEAEGVFYTYSIWQPTDDLAEVSRIGFVSRNMGAGEAMVQR